MDLENLIELQGIAPTVSIVIPHFNREKIITTAIESVSKQVYQNWECIIVDDGSAESSKNFVKTILSEERFKKFFFFERPANRLKGANACRNIGVEKARGSYIALLDSDDSWPENYLTEALKFAESKQDFTASYSGAIVYRNNVKRVIESRAVADGEKLFDFLLSPGVIAQTSSYFLRKDIATRVKFDEELKRHQDYDFFIRLGKQYQWFYNPNSKSIVDWSTINTRRTDFDSYLTVYERHKDEFKAGSNYKKGYLISCMGMALSQNAKSGIIKFYQRELREVGYAKKPGLIFMINFPYIFTYYKRVANLLAKFKNL